MNWAHRLAEEEASDFVLESTLPSPSLPAAFHSLRLSPPPPQSSSASSLGPPPARGRRKPKRKEERETARVSATTVSSTRVYPFPIDDVVARVVRVVRKSVVIPGMGSPSFVPFFTPAVVVPVGIHLFWFVHVTFFQLATFRSVHPAHVADEITHAHPIVVSIANLVAKAWDDMLAKLLAAAKSEASVFRSAFMRYAPYALAEVVALSFPLVFRGEPNPSIVFDNRLRNAAWRLVPELLIGTRTSLSLASHLQHSLFPPSVLSSLTDKLYVYESVLAHHGVMDGERDARKKGEGDEEEEEEEGGLIFGAFPYSKVMAHAKHLYRRSVNELQHGQARVFVTQREASVEPPTPLSPTTPLGRKIEARSRSRNARRSKTGIPISPATPTPRSRDGESPRVQLGGGRFVSAGPAMVEELMEHSTLFSAPSMSAVSAFGVTGVVDPEASATNENGGLGPRPSTAGIVPEGILMGPAGLYVVGDEETRLLDEMGVDRRTGDVTDASLSVSLSHRSLPMHRVTQLSSIRPPSQDRTLKTSAYQVTPGMESAAHSVRGVFDPNRRPPVVSRTIEREPQVLDPFAVRGHSAAVRFGVEVAAKYDRETRLHYAHSAHTLSQGYADRAAALEARTSLSRSTIRAVSQMAERDKEELTRQENLVLDEPQERKREATLAQLAAEINPTFDAAASISLTQQTYAKNLDLALTLPSHARIRAATSKDIQALKMELTMSHSLNANRSAQDIAAAIDETTTSVFADIGAQNAQTEAEAAVYDIFAKTVMPST